MAGNLQEHFGGGSIYATRDRFVASHDDDGAPSPCLLNSGWSGLPAHNQRVRFEWMGEYSRRKHSADWL